MCNFDDDQVLLLKQHASELWSQIQNEFIDIVKESWPTDAMDEYDLEDRWEAFKFECQCEEVTDWETAWFGLMEQMVEARFEGLPHSSLLLIWVFSQEFNGSEPDLCLLTRELMQSIRGIAEKEEPIRPWYS